MLTSLILITSLFAYTASQSDDFLSDKPALIRFLDNFELGLRCCLDWRAQADIREELTQLAGWFGGLALVLLGLAAVAKHTGTEELHISLMGGTLFFGFAWCSFRWTFFHSETIKPVLPWCYFAAATPWLVWALDLSAGTNAMGELAEFLLPFDMKTSHPALIAAAWSGITIIFASTAYALYWSCFIIVPLLVIFLLALTRFLASKILRRYGSKLLKNFTFGLGAVLIVYDNLKG